MWLRSSAAWHAAAWRWLVACLWCLAAHAAAAPLVQLQPGPRPVPLVDQAEFWIDEGGTRGADDVALATGAAWQAADPHRIYGLDPENALWLRFTVAPLRDPGRWYLEVPYPQANRVTLYTPDAQGRWMAQSAGDTVPVADWPVPHRFPVLPIMVPTREPRTYLLRIENPHTFSAPLSLVSEGGFAREEQRAALTLGMYFGLALLAFMVGVLGAGWLRDSAFGWYAVAVGTMALTQASLSGVAGLHLWPRLARWNDLAPFVLPVLACGALVRFFASVLGVRLLSPALFRWVLAVVAGGLLVAMLLGVAEPAWRVRLLVGYTSLCAVTSVIIFAWASRRRDRFAALMIWANVPVLLGSAFPLARIAGLIPTSFLTSYGMQIGLAVELPILLLVLMLRSQSRRENIRRLHALDRIDPASGLINAAVFQERLVRLIARSQRLKFRASVLVIDIVNVERIARDFDRRAVQELPLRVAGRLLSVTRDVDSVARLGEHRFGMLLEGPLKADEVAAAGPRVVAQCLMPFKNKPLNWVAEVRVAQALVPQDGTDAALLLQQLDALLAAVPAESKRAVFMLGLGDRVAVAS